MDNSANLKKRTITGMFWSFSDLIANQGINILFQILLARLLLPRDFGIIAMIYVFISVSEAIVDSSFGYALIREPNANQTDYSTVFYFNLAMGAIMYALLFLTSPAISSFFNEPLLIPVLRVLALVLIINSFGMIQRTILTKEIDFKTQTRVSLISSISSGIVGVIMAYLGFGVWSLVCRTLFMQASQTVLLIFYNKWHPSRVFSMTSFKRLFHFGWKLLVAGLINTFYQNLYYLIIGKSFSVIDLGYYTNAQKLRDAASQSIAGPTQRVSYPVLSTLQGDAEKLKRGYKKIIKTSAFVTFPIMSGLYAIAPGMILLLLGAKWESSIVYFQILCIAGILNPLQAINLNVLQVMGRSDLHLKLEILKKVLGLTVIGLILFLKLGILGLLWGAVFNSVVQYYMNSYFSASLISYPTKEQVKDIMPILMISVAMGFIAYLIPLLFSGIGMFIVLLIQIAIGVTFYIMASRIFRIEELGTLAEIFRGLLKREHT
jgi:O-antigen/teichoic acid export membrane protein